MIPKRLGLLASVATSEVDFREATKDASNILVKWLHEDYACTRAFIFDLQFRDDCSAALKIFSCAQEKAKQIPIEYIEMFGKDGTGQNMSSSREHVFSCMARQNIGGRERQYLG